MAGFGVLGGAAAAASLVALATRAWERGEDLQALALVVGSGLAGALLATLDSLRARAACRLPEPPERETRVSPPIGLRPSPLNALAGAVDEPVVVVDARRLVTHLNPAATAALGSIVGRPLPPESGIERALERARASGGTAVAVLRPTGEREMSARVVDLGLDVGAVIVLTGAARRESMEARPRVVGRRRGPSPDEPLVTLPISAVWTAATSTRVGEGRLIAFGCERLSGERVFRTMSLDMLFDPGVEPEPEAVALHGVDAAMIRGSRDAVAALNDIEGMLRGTVLVAVDAERTIEALCRECSAAGRAEIVDHPRLDLALLAAAADDGDPGRGPAALREAFGVESMTRHGVFAPVHEAAELTARILGRLRERGVVTLADAQALEAVQRGRVAQT